MAIGLGQCLAFLATGSAVQLGMWLALRPDMTRPTWTIGNNYKIWMALEAFTAIGIGAITADRKLAMSTVALGWVLQILHFGSLGEHYDDPLWGVGVYVQAFLAGIALAFTLLSQRLSGGLQGRRLSPAQASTATHGLRVHYGRRGRKNNAERRPRKRAATRRGGQRNQG